MKKAMFVLLSLIVCSLTSFAEMGTVEAFEAGLIPQRNSLDAVGDVLATIFAPVPAGKTFRPLAPNLSVVMVPVSAARAPMIWSFEVGLVVPMPTLPLSKTTNLSVGVLSAMRKTKPAPVPAPMMFNFAVGLAVPMPTLPDV